MEIVNFVNVIGQIYFIDFFLDGEFLKYGTDVFHFTGLEHEDRPDPMAVVFPKGMCNRLPLIICKQLTF